MDVTRESERDKQEFTDALNHCLDLLRANNYITDLNSDVITRKAAVIGQEMYESLKRIRDRSRTIITKTNQNQPVIDIPHDHLVRNVINPVNQIHYIKEEPPEIIETEETELYEIDNERKITVKDVKSLEGSDDFDIKRPVSDDEEQINGEVPHRIKFNRGKRRGRRPYERIPIEEKIRVVNLARSNANWTLNWLKEKSGCQRLSSIIQLKQWEKQVMQNSTILDKLNVINGWVYSKYLQEKERNSDVTDSMLRDWANEASIKFVYPRFKFEANDAWIAAFKKIHGIRTGDIYED
uniref:HTH CENPB-type domain-containing protein n=1 Tax=Bracon brevicornis TaxID=1563983 RepID=A0A6V7J681_9HYME